MWDSKGEAATWWSLENKRVANDSVLDFVNPNAFWYPVLTTAMGDGIIYLIHIAVDLETDKTAMVMGPYQSLSSPDRFRSITVP